MQQSPHIRNIALDIILTLLTFGLWNIYIQYKQIRAVNALLGEAKYSFGMWAFLTLITFFLYHIYHEYRISRDLNEKLKRPDSNGPLVHLLLSVFGMTIIVDALQQSEINELFGSKGL